ncbi:MAG TPA: hypothetical protein VMG12_33215 [Polyangiaceae bacterium]|nr:hypothetical protein [Polyangiaceae bacterium]
MRDDPVRARSIDSSNARVKQFQRWAWAAHFAGFHGRIPIRALFAIRVGNSAATAAIVCRRARNFVVHALGSRERNRNRAEK